MRVLATSLKKITAISFVLSLLISSFVLAQDVNFRVMTYNGLKLDGTDTDRQSAFQTVLQASNPDVLLMQEIVDAAGADLILTALNAGGNQYSRATFINGTDTDNMLFYRTSIGTLTSQNEIPTALREFSEYVMQIGDNEIRFYSAHLKASSGSTNEQKRLDEVTVLRNHLNNLPAGTEFVVVGDFNIYDSNEPAYQKFIANEADNDGRAEDPLASSGGVGDWHVNAAFASVHTQSPRTTQFGGGAHGGLDDRFDFILTSFGINDNSKVDMVPGTYTAFGNDGNHFDTSLLDGPNSAVSATVAQAIHDASDHLPVYADFVSLSNGGGSNLPPVAEANGPYNGNTTSPISFSSAGSIDNDGIISTYAWDFGDGNTSTSANPSYTYTSDGSYTASLMVTDNNGATNTDFANVTVSTGSGSGAGVVISEVFYDTPGTDSQEEWVELYNGTGSAVDLSGWTITDNNGTGASITIPGGTIIQSGTYLTVATNSLGFNAIYGYDADVYGSLPALNNTGDALILADNTSSVVDAVAWEGGASSGVPAGWGSSSAPSASTGSSIVRTSVTSDTDSFSDWSSASGNGNPQTQPTNTPPIAVANGPYSGNTGANISFSSAGSSDSDGTIVSYNWNFGDGNTSISATPTHSYAQAGSYTVQLTVTDDGGATDVATAGVTVTDIAGTGLLFSEIFYDTPGTDSDEEWIEIYNSTGSSLSLDNWTVTDNNGTGSVYTFPANTTIESGTYLTVAANSVGFTSLYSYDADLYGSVPALNNTGDALLLKNSAGQLIDAVAWEGGASAGLPNGWGSASDPSAPTGSTILRTNSGTDTDSFSDWSISGSNGNPETQTPPNSAPIASANGTYSGTVGTAVSFSSTGTSDSDGTIAGYLWDFGDGNTSTSANPSHSYQTDGTFTVSLTVTDNEGATGVDQTSATVDPVANPSGIKFTQDVITGVGSGWQTVSLSETYSSMVVIASPVYDNNDAPAVVRIRNASGNSFDIKVQNPGNNSLSGYTVHYIALEEGVYTDAADGVKMEAVKFSSSVTDRKGSWNGQIQTYTNSYSSPVVLGQVMTENDTDWSVFWARGSSRTAAPNSSNLRVGKHVGEDPDQNRANETIGYLVMESGSGVIETTSYSAGLGSDIVKSVTNAPPYNYSVSGLSSSEGAIVSAAAMDGNDGGWPLLYGSSAVSSTSLSVAFDEDQVANTERSHTTEQVAYMVIGTPAVAKAVASNDEQAEELPTEVTLGNYPNPFNPTTNIHFTLTESNNVRLTVYNMIGQEVAVLVNGFKKAGKHDVTFDAANLSTGVYIYRLVSGGQVKVQKMLLTK